ncbi:hypothetical protein COOONC_05463 [Cooperia oncophora]
MKYQLVKLDALLEEEQESCETAEAEVRRNTAVEDETMRQRCDHEKCTKNAEGSKYIINELRKVSERSKEATPQITRYAEEWKRLTAQIESGQRTAGLEGAKKRRLTVEQSKNGLQKETWRFRNPASELQRKPEEFADKMRRREEIKVLIDMCERALETSKPCSSRWSGSRRGRPEHDRETSRRSQADKRTADEAW